MLFLKSADLHVSRPSKCVTFDLRPPRSSYKALFQGTELGEALKRMSLSKAVPEGLKSVECERGIGGKNSRSTTSRSKTPSKRHLRQSIS